MHTWRTESTMRSGYRLKGRRKKIDNKNFVSLRLNAMEQRKATLSAMCMCSQIKAAGTAVEARVWAQDVHRRTADPSEW